MISEDHIDNFRKVIDRIDEMLISLLGERIRNAKAIGTYKRRHGLPLLDKDRELHVIGHITQLAKDHGLDEHEAYIFADQLLRIGKDAQETD